MSSVFRSKLSTNALQESSSRNLHHICKNLAQISYVKIFAASLPCPPNPERSKVHTYPKTKQTGAHPFLIHQKHTEQIRNKYGATQTNPLQIQFPYKFRLTLIHSIYNPHTKQTKVMLRSTPYQIRISYSPILLTQASHTEHMLY